MSQISTLISNAYNSINLNTIEDKPTIIENFLFPIEKLGSPKNTSIEPYPFDENKEDFFEALCAAYPNPSDYEEWLIGVFALCYLVQQMDWPENEARHIRVTWECLATDKSKINLTENDKTWRSALNNTTQKINTKSAVTHLTVLKIAHSKGWQASSASIPKWLEEMNCNFFIAPYSTAVAIFTKSNDVFIPLKNDSFKLLLANKSVDIPTLNGTKKVPIADAWLKHEARRQYAGVGFWPASKAPTNYFNFWQEWAIKPAKGDVNLALEHIQHVICNGDIKFNTYVIGWLAHCVQHPNKPGNVALVIKGGRGTGKTMFAEWIKYMFGKHAMSIANGNLLTGSFTGHLQNLVLLVAEEAFWAGDKQAENALKHVITGNTLSIHPKGYAPYDAPNYLHVIMTSNEEWVVPAGVDERRFAVCNTSEDKKGDFEYFTKLAQWAESGGIAALLDYLLAYDLSDFNVRNPPDTQALRDQKFMSLDPITRWIMHRLEVGAFVGSEWNQNMSSALMINNLCEHQQLQIHERRRAETILGNTLRKIFKGTKKTRQRIGTSREAVYQLPVTSLHEARLMFERFMGIDGHDWGSDA